MIWLQSFIAIAIGCSAIYWIVSLICTMAFFRRRRVPHPEFAPPVSILKPMCGLDEDLEANLRALCRQEYPNYQILFGVEDEADPCVPVIRKIIDEFPDKEIALVVCGKNRSANRKVHKLQALMAKARHDVLILADSDVRMNPDCLKQIVVPLADETVGLVCCPYRWKAPRTVPAALEALTSCIEFIPSVLLVERFEGLKFALGATMVVRRRCLDEIGGLEAIRDYLADDYQLGRRIHESGHRLAMSDHVVDLIHHQTTWQRLAEREIRLARTYRACRPVGFFLSLLTHGMTWAALFLWTTGGSPSGWAVWLGTLSFRLILSLVLLLGYFPDAMTIGFCWLMPVRDWFASLWWLLAYTGKRVTWRGNTYVMGRDGKLQPSQ